MEYKMTYRWDKYFLDIAYTNALMSKDPSTKVGAVIVGQNNNIISTGFNGFPIHISDTSDRLNNRDVKLKLVVHAELNAILSAARNGIKVDKSTIYLLCYDVKQSKVWGTLPCIRCLVKIIQAGITNIVYGITEFKPKKDWDNDSLVAPILYEAKIHTRSVDYYNV